jgi:ubiquinone/menaquinone biosynthesis C-methylase UbiE
VPRISYSQAKTFYDACGRWLDGQRWLEDPAFDDLVAHAGFDRAHRVVEFGCGTGRLARRLCADLLPPQARYLGFDLSPRMRAITRRRLAPFGSRASVLAVSGPPRLPLASHCCDRFVATYVLDLLAPADVDALLGEAHRTLGPRGRLCVAVMAAHPSRANRVFRALWTSLHRLSPVLVGGTQPADASAWLNSGWRLRHCRLVCKFSVCSQVLVAERLPEARPQEVLVRARFHLPTCPIPWTVSSSIDFPASRNVG